jgi:hypothetical protein
MKPVNVQFIENADQRYDTCGDYWEQPASLEVRVTQYRNTAYSQLILIHELVELFLVQQRGIKLSDIDEFDMMFLDEGEPGDDPRAPYYKEHRFATMIERLCAAEMGVDWAKYELAVDEGEPFNQLWTEDYE